MNLQLTPVVKILAIMNVAVFVIGLLLGMDVPGYFGLRYFLSEAFQPYQIITHFFVHFTFFHLLFNMFALISFGPMLEVQWGAKRFLFFYIFCAMGSALLNSGFKYVEFQKVENAKTVFMANPSPEYFISFVRSSGNDRVEHYLPENFIENYEKNPENEEYISAARYLVNDLYRALANASVMAGASGAIFGLLVAFAMLFPNTELMLMFIPFPVKAKYFVLIYAGVELFLGVSRFKGDTIGHFAHLGGALFGFILMKYWQKQRNTFY
jgi:membrane associated rhomboid family serine protease